MRSINLVFLILLSFNISAFAVDKPVDAFSSQGLDQIAKHLIDFPLIDKPYKEFQSKQINGRDIICQLSAPTKRVTKANPKAGLRLSVKSHFPGVIQLNVFDQKSHKSRVLDCSYQAATGVSLNPNPISAADLEQYFVANEQLKWKEMTPIFSALARVGSKLTRYELEKSFPKHTFKEYLTYTTILDEKDLIDPKIKDANQN